MRTIWLQTSQGGEPVELVVQPAPHEGNNRFRVRFRDHDAMVTLLMANGQSGALCIDGRVLPFHAVCTNNQVDLWLNGRYHRFGVVDRAARRAGDGAAAQTASDVTAGMPGTILKILAGVGDRFEAHAPLIVMESMKMEMTLSAPRAGRVREVLCRVGELVEMGEMLMRIEPLDRT